MSISVTAETRIADLVAADPAALDRLAGFHPLFSAMRDPQSRGAIADLPSLGEAARAADLPLEAILAIPAARSGWTKPAAAGAVAGIEFSYCRSDCRI
jgi:hypothetical protein